VNRILVVAAIALPGLLGLAIGGYFVVENVLFQNLGAGPDACTVTTPAIAGRTLGGDAHLIGHDHGPGYTSCTYDGAGLFLRVEIGRWDIINSNVLGSGRPNQGTGAGTYLLNTSTTQDSTLAADSWLGRVARRGAVGVYVTAGHYGQFFGAAAERELALEDRIEQKAVAEVLPRV
jgi:hypothetical protein